VYLRRLSGLGAFEEVEGREFDLDLDEVHREDFVLGSTVFGEVRRSGTSVRFARVSVSRPTGTGARLNSTALASASAWTDSEGTYRIANAPTGKVLVAVESGERLTTQRADIPNISPFQLDIDLPGHPILGVVLDAETGDPLAGAIVRLARGSGGNDDLMILTSSTAIEGGEVLIGGSAEITQSSSKPDGSFTLWVPEQGTYELTAHVAGYSQRQAMATTSDEVVIELEKGASLSGHVVGPQVRGHDFAIACLVGGQGRSCKGVQGADFGFEMVDPGSYGVVVAVTNKGLALKGNVEVRAGENEPLEVVLRPAPDVMVALGTDETTDHLVSLRDSTGSDLLPMLRMALLEPVRVQAGPGHESGYLVRGLPVGTYELHTKVNGQARTIQFTTGGE
jgi:hypothetical protein